MPLKVPWSVAATLALAGCAAAPTTHNGSAPADVVAPTKSGDSMPGLLAVVCPGRSCPAGFFPGSRAARPDETGRGTPRPMLSADLQGSFDDWPDDFPWDDDTPETAIRDPFEPVNRAVFVFNDRLYFWVVKPVATGYAGVVPEPARTALRNFFTNVATPVRLGNCLLQGKFEGAGIELARFGINSTLGVAGFGDPAWTRFHLQRRDEDLGQTLAVWGLRPGVYFVWPLVGPSCPRDTVGAIGDGFLDPLNYLPWWPVQVGAKVLDGVNRASLRLGAYENLKKAALDPYVAIRTGYYEARQFQIDDHH